MGGLNQPIPDNAVHLCVDMQVLFSSEGLWAAPWMERVLPVVADLATRHAERTIFTRFVTPVRAEDMPGMWRAYYRRWEEATRERIDSRQLELLLPLRALCPPAVVIDKTRYSAFAGSELLAHLADRNIDTLIVTGSETDVCVLATVLDAVDFGFRVIVVRDAICSSSDAGHDALMTVYHRRFGVQIETADAEEVLKSWQADRR